MAFDKSVSETVQVSHLHDMGYGFFSFPCPAHAGYMGTDRTLLMAHNALLLQQIARNLLQALPHGHDNTTWPLVNQSVALVGAS